MTDPDDFSSMFDETPAPAEAVTPQQRTNCNGIGHTGCGVCDACTGTPVTPQQRRGRPRTREIYPEVQAANEAEDAALREFYASREGRRRISAAATGRYETFTEKEFFQPVPVSFLSKHLRINAETVRKRLETVTPVGHAGVSQNRPLYDFASVVPYLVKSKMNLRTYLRSLNPADMPVNISKVFWEAERIRNKTMIETAEAWPTENVLEVFGQVFMLIKDRIPLITDALQDAGCNETQVRKLQEMCDQFQNDLHQALIELPKQQSTPSRVADVAVGVDDE